MPEDTEEKRRTEADAAAPDRGEPFHPGIQTPNRPDGKDLPDENIEKR
jgi:hypothetical protein